MVECVYCGANIEIYGAEINFYNKIFPTITYNNKYIYDSCKECGRIFPTDAHYWNCDGTLKNKNLQNSIFKVGDYVEIINAIIFSILHIGKIGRIIQINNNEHGGLHTVLFLDGVKGYYFTNNDLRLLKIKEVEIIERQGDRECLKNKVKKK